MFKIIFIACLIFFSFQTTNGQIIIPENEFLRAIRKEIQEMVDKRKIPSLAIAVIKDGRIIWQEAIGFADVDLKVPATVNHAYPLGSVSKSVTATGIMQLINSRKLDLQSDIRPLITPIRLKNIDGETPAIKLWQLVSQNAGITHGYGTFPKNIGIPKTTEARKRFFEKAVVIAFPPGTVYEYSNHSFSISELIIEKVSGDSYEKFMNKNIFLPLGMEHTYAYPINNPEQEKNIVSIYSDKMEKLKNDFIAYPSGGMGNWSSIKDMSRYLLFHLGIIKDSNLISDKNLNLMHNFRQGPADLFGIGWFNTGGELFSNGNVSGGNASVTISKKNNFAVVCLLNRTSWDGIADMFAGKIRDVFFKEQNTGGYLAWQRIYGTPYSARYELDGIWKGRMIEPESDKLLPVELNFKADGSVVIKLDNKESILRNVTFNLFGELEAGMTLVLPGITKDEVRCSFKLKRDENMLNGYLQYDGEVEGVDYRLPLLIELKKLNTINKSQK